MPIEIGVWRIDKELSKLDPTSIDLEKRLEDFLDKDITLASPNWIIIGRQVPTLFGHYIDLLALDQDGRLVVIELKKDKTPREVIAQLLDYGSWVRELKDEDIASIFERYAEKYHPEFSNVSLNEHFAARFQGQEIPDVLNDSHELVIVAASLDESTERIVSYLATEYEVAINALFFRVFRDGDREFLTRVWFIDPTKPIIGTGPGPKNSWNGEYYVSFGDGPSRKWEDAVKYGFISAGHGSWYSKTLSLLEPGGRVWVNVPGRGYVGVGEVLEPVTRADRFELRKDNGERIPITKMAVNAPTMFEHLTDDEMAEHLVRVKWIKTVELSEAIKEKGLFGNQNSVCKPTAKRWDHTVDRLKKRFNLS